MNKSITNKELIEKLYEYYLTQDPRIIARAFANAVIDLSRVLNASTLPPDEMQRLVFRMQMNEETLKDFIENKANGAMFLFNCSPQKD